MWGSRRRLQLWKSALAQNRLSEVETSGLWTGRATVSGRSGPVEVRISDASSRGSQVVVVIEGPEGFSALKLRHQAPKLWGREIVIGDKAFDGTFLVEGPLQPVCALLDVTLRRQLFRASAACSSFEIGGGRLRVELPERELTQTLFLLLDIGWQLAEPLDAASMERRIIQNARRDPKTGVRLLNLQLLARERPDAPGTLEMLRAACSDGSPKVRARAAIELGDERRDVLLEIARKSGDDEASAQAVAHLGGKLPFERLRDILSRALHRGLRQTACACVEALGHRRAAAVGVLARVLVVEKGQLAVAAALALGTTGEEAAEPPLLQALQRDESDLREAAATALGHVGSVAAVQPLKETAERFWLDLGLRRAARQAIAEIQSRLQGASPGQLSLAGAEDGDGQLSLADDPTGQLSLPRDTSSP